MIYFVFVFLLFFEFSLRLFYSIKYEKYKILIRPFCILEKYYPGIGEAMSEQINDNNGAIDILFLGGSVLHSDWGTIEQELKGKLMSAYSCDVNIDNLALTANTSLDSKIKYDLLKDQHYDIILLYHGINEVRFNNCPESFFKDDYSHVEFYNNVYSITNLFSRFSIFPHAFNSLKIKSSQMFGNKKLLPLGKSENSEWLDYGRDIKTSRTFYKNYEAIIEVATKSNAVVVIPTFAYYVPIGYSLTDFQEKKLDYTKFICPIEIWGNTENVVKGIETHNKAIEAYWKDNSQMENLYFIDMNDSLTKKGSNFDDVCHLTHDGSTEYASIIYSTFSLIIDKNKLCLTKNKRH